MRIVTVKTDVFKYEELTPEAQEKARDHFREFGLDHKWWDSVTEDAKKIGALMGIDIDAIYFSGFSSQGDGAQFVGTYQYKRGSVAAVKAYAPQDKELHEIAKALFDIQRKHFYQISATVKSSGHYSHEYCTTVDVNDNRNYYGWVNDGDDVESDLAEVLRDFMRWIYRQLENEYDWLNSDEVVAEAIICNEYEFTADGRID